MNKNAEINNFVVNGQLPTVEIHILRPVEASNKNRDFNNRIKTVNFGKGKRVRWSSQATKKPITKRLSEISKEISGIESVHSRMFPCNVKRVLEDLMNTTDEQVSAYINAVEAYLGSKENAEQTSQVIFFSNLNVKQAATAFCDLYQKVENKEKLMETLVLAKSKEDKDKKKKEKTEEQKALEALNKEMEKEAARLEVDPMAALTGKMSTDPAYGASVEYAALHMSHPYSVDLCHDDIDTYVATDDLISGNKYASFIAGVNTANQGGGFMGDIDMAANVYYEYASISTRLLFENLLANYTDDTLTREILNNKLEIVQVLTKEFIKLFTETTPEAKQTTMASNPLPYVTLVLTGKNMFTHTSNRFEKVVTGRGYDSIGDEAVSRLSEEASYWTNGAFARDYDRMFWVTDLYVNKVPAGAECVSRKVMLDGIFA